MKKLRVLVACEYSGTVRDEFIKLGHDAISCDILPSDKPGPHYQGDIFHMLCDSRYSTGFDLIIAHPPCTYLCNSGVRWLYNKDGSKNSERWENLSKSTRFFNSLLASNSDHICIENPIPHKHANLPAYSQTIQPYEFGHTTSKRTCLWLKGLPELTPTDIVPKENRSFDIHLASPGPDRWKIRSKTFPGIAKAMAQQWSEYLSRGIK